MSGGKHLSWKLNVWSIVADARTDDLLYSAEAAGYCLMVCGNVPAEYNRFYNARPDVVSGVLAL